MKLTLLKLLLLFGASVLLFTSSGCDADLTVIYVVRHAEKLNDADPNSLLSPAGHQRAQALRDKMSDQSLMAIYHSNIERTKQTAAPTAEDHGITPKEFPWQNHLQLVNDIITNHSGDVVLVVGHSNTVGPTIEALGAEFGTFPDDEYDNLWIVVRNNDSGTAGLTSVKYP